MRSGGDRLLASVHRTYAVDVDLAARDVGEQLRRVEPPELEGAFAAALLGGLTHAFLTEEIHPLLPMIDGESTWIW